MLQIILDPLGLPAISGNMISMFSPFIHYIIFLWNFHAKKEEFDHPTQ